MAAALRTWDMAVSAADLLRVLAAMPQCRARRLEPGCVRLPLGGGEARVRYTSLPDRALGLLRMPATRIEMEFDGVPEAEARAFVEAFETYSRRAGG